MRRKNTEDLFIDYLRLTIDYCLCVLCALGGLKSALIRG